MPDYDAAGYSNEEAKRESRDTIEQLLRAKAGSVVSELEYPEEYNWLYGKSWSELEDYDD